MEFIPSPLKAHNTDEYYITTQDGVRRRSFRRLLPFCVLMGSEEDEIDITLSALQGPSKRSVAAHDKEVLSGLTPLTPWS